MQGFPESSQNHRKKRTWLILISVGLLLLMLFIIATLIVGKFAKDELIAAHPAPGQLIDIGGYQLHLHCMGEGSPTVIMEAGLNEFSITWSRVQSSLARSNRVCVYDRAGFAWSDSSPLPRTVSNMVNELHMLLTNSDVDTPYVLVGHSFGGIIMRIYANQYPEDVIGMVLVDASHENMIALNPDLFQPSTEQLIAQFQNLTTMSNSGILALALDQIPAPDFPELAIEQYRAILASTPYFETAIAESTLFADNLAQLRGFDVFLGDLPLVIISRGQSEPLPYMDDADVQEFDQLWMQWQSELVALSNNSKQIIAQNSGHYIQLSEPEIVIAAIRELVLSLQ